MSTNLADSGTSRQQNPTEILRAQYEILTRLYQETETQNEILRDPMTGLDNCIVKHQVRVKIEDINMPFVAMIGLMIKIALASIPALIILGILFALLWGAVAVFLSAIIAGIF